MTMEYVDVFELAELLGRAPETVRKNLSRRPWMVPTPMHIPGTKILRWRAAEVNVWIAEQRAVPD